MSMNNVLVAISTLNLNQLVALQVLLHERSVGRAARVMGVTQSAMSHSLRGLRELLGDPLLVRVGNDMVSTPYADEVLPRLRSALGELDAIVSGRAAFDPSVITDTFTLGAADGPAGIVSGHLYSELAARAPRSRLRIAPVVADNLASDLLDGTIDVALVPPLIALDGLSSLSLGTSADSRGFEVVCRDDHPRVQKRLTLRTFCDLPHAMVSIHGDGPSFVDGVLAQQGRSREIVARVAHLIAVPGLLLASDMLHTNAKPAARFLCRHWPLKSFSLPFDVPAGDLLMVWHPRYDHDPASRFFRDIVQAAAQSAGAEVVRGGTLEPE